MHPNVKHLIELQAEDLRLAELRAELAGFPGRLAEIERRVAAARAALEAARAALTKSHTDRKTLELDVEQWKGRVRKYKDQTAQVKSNEAFRTLQHEIDMAEAEVARAEDRQLDQMVAAEEIERQVKAAERALKETEAAAEAERRAAQAEQAAVERELAQRTAERERVVPQIPEDLLDHYQRIARRHAGVALAEVREETCTMCRVKVRPHVYEELRNPASQQIIHCESCTRILYYAGPAGQGREPVAQAGGNSA